MSKTNSFIPLKRRYFIFLAKFKAVILAFKVKCEKKVISNTRSRETLLKDACISLFKSHFWKEKRGMGRKGKHRRGKLPIYRNMAMLKFFNVQLRTVQVTAFIF